MSNQKMIIALLGVVAVLLAVIVGVLVFKSPSSSNVADNSGVSTAPSSVTGTGTGTGMPAATDPNAPFDAKTATKVSGTPKDHVNKYFTAIVKKDWKTAYDLLPKDKQATYGSADAFGQQLASYGASGYKVVSDQASGDTEVISADLTTSGGPFTYQWTFVKYNGAWVVKSRTIPGMDSSGGSGMGSTTTTGN